MTIQKILLVVAMRKEAHPIVARLGLSMRQNILDADLPVEIYQSNIKQGVITLVCSGLCPQHGVDRIGTEGLNLVIWEAIKALTPDLAVNVGTGGGFHKLGAQPGDIYVSAGSVKYHDRLFYPDMHFLHYGIGSYPCIESSFLAKELALKQGIISTGGSMITSLQEEIQMQKNQAAVKDMEAAGIAEVAHLKKVPFTALKIITDLVDTSECPQNQFTNNFDKLINHLADKTHQLCFLLMGKQLEDIDASASFKKSSVML